MPTDGTGTANDNTNDIGFSSFRFKDLYLGGGVYLGGTGSANLLDDYEEGTWTPVIADATSGGNTASASIDRSLYTKVGRQITATTRIINIDTTGMTAANVIYVRGLPFTSKSDNITIGAVKIASVNLRTRTDCIVQIGTTDTWVSFVAQGNNQSINNVDVQDMTSGTSDITFTITYFAPA